MAGVVERYLTLGLSLVRHVDGLVDSYYGPAELAAAVDATPPVDPAKLAAEAEALAADVSGARRCARADGARAPGADRGAAPARGEARRPAGDRAARRRCTTSPGGRSTTTSAICAAASSSTPTSRRPWPISSRSPRTRPTRVTTPNASSRSRCSFAIGASWRSRNRSDLGAYAVTYSAGKSLCRGYVDNDSARFRTLLTEQVRVSDLLAAQL